MLPPRGRASKPRRISSLPQPRIALRTFPASFVLSLLALAPSRDPPAPRAFDVTAPPSPPLRLHLLPAAPQDASATDGARERIRMSPHAICERDVAQHGCHPRVVETRGSVAAKQPSDGVVRVGFRLEQVPAEDPPSARVELTSASTAVQTNLDADDTASAVRGSRCDERLNMAMTNAPRSSRSTPWGSSRASTRYSPSASRSSVLAKTRRPSRGTASTGTRSVPLNPSRKTRRTSAWTSRPSCVFCWYFRIIFTTRLNTRTHKLSHIYTIHNAHTTLPPKSHSSRFKISEELSSFRIKNSHSLSKSPFVLDCLPMRTKPWWRAYSPITAAG